MRFNLSKLFAFLGFSGRSQNSGYSQNSECSQDSGCSKAQDISKSQNSTLSQNSTKSQNISCPFIFLKMRAVSKWFTSSRYSAFYPQSLQESPKKQILKIIAVVSFFILLFLLEFFLYTGSININLAERKIAPNLQYLFGTDWLGRDMFERTLLGLKQSLFIGIFAAIGSSFIALFLASVASLGGKIISYLVSLLTDTFLALPHIILLILIAFAFGGTANSVMFAVILTHWPRLTKLLHSEIMQLKHKEYILVSKKLGKKPLFIFMHHILPSIFPQFLVGTLLLFPHAIIHTAALSFLGFGFSPHEPSIGILLAESMTYISTGYWWLAFFPGLALVFTVKAFDVLARAIQNLLSVYNKG